MRIDPLSSAAIELSSEASSQQASIQSAAKTSRAGEEDRATLTSGSVSKDSLVSQALSSPEIRQDKVDSLRLSVESGKYELDSAKTAAAIVNEYA
jgi:negative regulator of flagellin synthesis FlgM